jgi:isoleucyl-tRNA synthetase
MLVNWENMMTLRSVAFGAMEELRAKGDIGKGEEAKLQIHLEGSRTDLRGMIDSRLVKEICKVSDAFFTWEYKNQDGFACSVTAESIKSNENYTQCPRCWFYHSIEFFPPNYDNLCDRCCRVMVQEYPDHPSVPKMKELLHTHNQLRKESPGVNFWKVST